MQWGLQEQVIIIFLIQQSWCYKTNTIDTNIIEIYHIVNMKYEARTIPQHPFLLCVVCFISYARHGVVDDW